METGPGAADRQKVSL